MIADRVCGLAVAGLLITVLLAPLSETAAMIAAFVLVGPFLLFGCVFVLAFALSLILYGEPDRLVDRLLG